MELATSIDSKYGIGIPSGSRSEGLDLPQIDMEKVSKALNKRKFKQVFFLSLIKATAFVLIGILLLMVGHICWNGLGAINLEFLTEAPRNMMSEGGIFPCIIGTMLLALGAMCFALPLGVGTAIWLSEYAKDGHLKNIIKMSVSNLAGVPSIVLGLFGLSFFVTYLGLGVSLIAGMLTLAVLVLPVVVNTMEESLSSVRSEWKEASYALGGTKSQTIFRVILPAAAPGMLTGAILSLARAAGETSAIMFTCAVVFSPLMPKSVFDSVMALPYHMYVLVTTGTVADSAIPIQYGTAVVLMLLVLSMNLVAIIIRDRMIQSRVR